MTADPRPGDASPRRARGAERSARGLPLRLVDVGAIACLDPTWLTAAIEQAGDSIVITDPRGTVRYVNAAFERETGRLRGDVVGERIWNPGAGEQPHGQYRAMMATVRRGRAWAGDLVLRRPDGTVGRAAAMVAPIRDADGVVTGMVAIQRDVTAERALGARLDAFERERTALAAAFETMAPGTTAEATATAIATPLLELPGLAAVGLWSFESNGDVEQLAVIDRVGGAWPGIGPLPADRAAYLRERASAGPWIEDWQSRPDQPHNRLMVEHGLRSLAYVPLHADRNVVGLLVLAESEPGGRGLIERLPAFVECASVAAALLTPQLRLRGQAIARRGRIKSIIAAHAFAPVFQPIVELSRRTAVGYEALTRFADGTAPDVVFAEAAACGLGIELEAATLVAVLEASDPLPASAWLNLNVSPEFVLAGEPLRSILRDRGWRVVLELTEHVAVDDYPALRAALAPLGDQVRLAVDDAGAGFASLRHILELRPDYVKLDRAIVAAIGQDPARQALVAGMVHFAAETRSILVAEGVETEAEAGTLSRLGVDFAQGYHLGPPADAGKLVRAARVSRRG